MTELLAQYSEQSGVAVTFEPQPDYDTTLQAALSAGDPPDFFYIDSLRLPDLAEAGALAPIPEGAITEPDDIYPSLTEAFTYDGTWYCPPKDFSTLGLVYNVDMLEAAGVEPPTNMEELAAAAEALTTEDVVGLSFGPELARAGVFMLANGGYIVNDEVTEMTLDTEENRPACNTSPTCSLPAMPPKPADLEAGWGGAPSARAGRRWSSRATGSSPPSRRISRISTGASSSSPKDRPAGRPTRSPCAMASAPSRRTRRRPGRRSTTSPALRAPRRGPLRST